MRAKKSLGQNFLRDEGVIRRIVDAVQIKQGTAVIEIGPGRGDLTERLLETGANVIAVEIDRELVPVLRTRFHFQTAFSCIEADILQIDLADVVEVGAARDTHLVGNLPYYISTAILQKLASERTHFARLVLMLQREVVERITAKPGDSSRGFLTVLTEAAFTTERVFDVPPTAFTPQPKVWSSVVVMTPKPTSAGDEPAFRKLVSAAFAQKRKTLLNNLKSYIPDTANTLAAASIDLNRRAETLTLDEWIKLYSLIK